MDIAAHNSVVGSGGRGSSSAPPDMQPRIRELRQADEALYPDFLAGVSAEDRRLRFFSPAPLSDHQIHAFTHLDLETAIAFVAVGPGDDTLYGVARLHRVGPGEGEFAVLVRSDLKGRGVGRRLMTTILAAAPRLGVTRVVGFVLRENTGMLTLARELGFVSRNDPDDYDIARVAIELGGLRTAA